MSSINDNYIHSGYSAYNRTTLDKSMNQATVNHIFETIQVTEWIQEVIVTIFITTITCGKCWSSESFKKTFYQNVIEGRRAIELIDPYGNKKIYLEQVEQIFQKIDQQLIDRNSFESLDLSIATAWLYNLPEELQTKLMPKTSKFSQERIKELDISLLSWDELRKTIVIYGKCHIYRHFLGTLSEKQLNHLLDKLSCADAEDKAAVIQGLHTVCGSSKIDAIIDNRIFGNFHKKLGHFLGKDLTNFSYNKLKNEIISWYKSNHTDRLPPNASQNEIDIANIRLQQMGILKNELNELLSQK